jgi:Domain of unknown function (DUF4345)
MKFNEALPRLFRLILVIVGLVTILVGINVGFGGIQTLGWQIAPDFLTVTNEAAYRVQDNHVRFLGGVFGAAGLMMLLGATNLNRFQKELRLVFILTFVGGLARFSSLAPNIIFGTNILTSSLTELLLMPVLFFWLPRILEQEPLSSQS